MKKITSPVFIVTLLLAGGISFYGGVKYGGISSATLQGQGQYVSRGSFQNLTQEERQQRFAEMGGGEKGDIGARFKNGGSANGGFMNGEVVLKDDTSLTVKLRDGGSKIIILSSDTVVIKSATGTSEDLLVGGQVTVTGEADSSGVITAKTIQVK